MSGYMFPERDPIEIHQRNYFLLLRIANFGKVNKLNFLLFGLEEEGVL